VEYVLDEATAALQRTPAVLDVWLRGIPENWAHANEGPETWSAYEVVGHLIHGERADWIERTRMILEYGESKIFTPFDRFAMHRESVGKSLETLLDEFATLRAVNLETLGDFGLRSTDLVKMGRHPSLGTVTLRQLLATWVVHDWGHLAQIARVLAKQYATEVGPWTEYLPVLHDRKSAASS
jgi:hypothetical protein